jgi:single-strand DNA-binding protein
MNRIIIKGRLTANPELRKTPNGLDVTSFTVAVNRYGSKEMAADFINCTAWRNTAVFIDNYFTKGKEILLEGSLQTRQYQDKDTGKNRTAYEVVVERAEFCGNKEGGQSTEPTPASTGFEPVADDEGDLPF